MLFHSAIDENHSVTQTGTGLFQATGSLVSIRREITRRIPDPTFGSHIDRVVSQYAESNKCDVMAVEVFENTLTGILDDASPLTQHERAGGIIHDSREWIVSIGGVQGNRSRSAIEMVLRKLGYLKYLMETVLIPGLAELLGKEHGRQQQVMAQVRNMGRQVEQIRQQIKSGLNNTQQLDRQVFDRQVNALQTNLGKLTNNGIAPGLRALMQPLIQQVKELLQMPLFVLKEQPRMATAPVPSRVASVMNTGTPIKAAPITSPSAKASAAPRGIVLPADKNTASSPIAASKPKTGAASETPAAPLAAKSDAVPRSVVLSANKNTAPVASAHAKSNTLRAPIGPQKGIASSPVSFRAAKSSIIVGNSVLPREMSSRATRTSPASNLANPERVLGAAAAAFILSHTQDLPAATVIPLQTTVQLERAVPVVSQPVTLQQSEQVFSQNGPPAVSGNEPAAVTPQKCGPQESLPVMPQEAVLPVLNLASVSVSSVVFVNEASVTDTPVALRLEPTRPGVAATPENTVPLVRNNEAAPVETPLRQAEISRSEIRQTENSNFRAPITTLTATQETSPPVASPPSVAQHDVHEPNAPPVSSAPVISTQDNLSASRDTPAALAPAAPPLETKASTDTGLKAANPGRPKYAELKAQTILGTIPVTLKDMHPETVENTKIQFAKNLGSVCDTCTTKSCGACMVRTAGKLNSTTVIDEVAAYKATKAARMAARPSPGNS
jgi:hypothetical protein